MKIEKEKIEAEKVVFDEIGDENLRSRETIYERVLPVLLPNMEFKLVIVYSDYWEEATEGQDNYYFLKSIEIVDSDMEGNPIIIPPFCGVSRKYSIFYFLESELMIYLIQNYETFAEEERYSNEQIKEIVNIIIEKLKLVLKENDITY